jgi:hypothetical protein
MVINFADKAVIGIAAVPIIQELELGPRQFELVGSSFILLFAVSPVATGFLINRVRTRWVLLAMGAEFVAHNPEGLTVEVVVAVLGVACRHSTQ